MDLTVVRRSLLAMLPLVSLTAGAADYYSNGFASMPSAFKLIDADGATLSDTYYKNLELTKAWTVGNVGRHGFAALSLSHTGNGTAQENWLIAPKISVTSADAFLTWDARSLLPDFKESYRVMIAVDDDENYTEVFSTEAESSTWISRTLPLADYVDHSVRVAFVCTSADKFILAIDNLEIGVPKANKFYVENSTPHFVSKETPIRAKIVNVGKTVTDGSVLVMVGTEQVGSIDLPQTFKQGGEVEVEYTLPFDELNSVSEYTLSVKDSSSDEATEILSDKMLYSHFPRKILVDKATATWCINCPEGDVILQHLEEQYGDEIVNVNTHTGDIMVQGDYFSNLGFYSIPSFKINRNDATTSSSNAYFDTEAYTPALVGLSGTASLDGDNEVTVTANIEFAEAWDNSSDRYRMGYTFTRDYYVTLDDPNSGKYVQSNSTLTAASGEQYYYMPSYIMPDINIFTNVTVDATAAFTGVAKSLPATISAGDKCEATFTATIPSKITDMDNARLVYYVMDTESGYVYNCDVIELKEASASVGSIIYGGNALSVKMNGNNCIVTGNNGEVSISVYSTDGRLVSTRKAQSTGGVSLDLPKGVSVIKVTDQSGQTATVKSIFR